MFISSLTESQVIAAVGSFITLLLMYLLSNLTSLIPTDALTQCGLTAIIWLAIAAITYSLMHNPTVSVLLGVIGEAVIWILYFVKSTLYESLLNNILNVLAISTKFDDFSLGILNYDTIVYYLSFAFVFVFLRFRQLRRRDFHKPVGM